MKLNFFDSNVSVFRTEIGQKVEQAKISISHFFIHSKEFIGIDPTHNLSIYPVFLVGTRNFKIQMSQRSCLLRKIEIASFHYLLHVDILFSSSSVDAIASAKVNFGSFIDFVIFIFLSFFSISIHSFSICNLICFDDIRLSSRMSASKAIQ